MEGKGKRERFCLEFLLGVRSRFEKKTKTKSKKEKKNICFLSRKKIHQDFSGIILNEQEQTH